MLLLVHVSWVRCHSTNRIVFFWKTIDPNTPKMSEASVDNSPAKKSNLGSKIQETIATIIPNVNTHTHTNIYTHETIEV